MGTWAFAAGLFGCLPLLQGCSKACTAMQVLVCRDVYKPCACMETSSCVRPATV